jgi:hypothetical protein
MDYLILVVLILVFLAGFILASSIYTLPARTPPQEPASTAKSTTVDLPDYRPPEDFEPPKPGHHRTIIHHLQLGRTISQPTIGQSFCTWPS